MVEINDQGILFTTKKRVWLLKGGCKFVKLFIVSRFGVVSFYIITNQQLRGKPTKYEVTKTFFKRSKHRCIKPTGGNKFNLATKDLLNKI